MNPKDFRATKNWSKDAKSNFKGVEETDVSLNVLEEVATGK